MHHGFTWFNLLPGLHHDGPMHVVGAVFVAAILIATTWVARVQLVRVMNSPGAGLIPEEKLTYRNFFEIVAEKLYGLTKLVIGEEAPRFFPVIGTLFVFIFTCNLIGLIPGFLPPTDNLNTTLALGTFVFVYYNYLGFKANGVGYLKHFLGPLLWLSPLMLIIELASHVFRPLSLALRLRGNIMGDHVVLSIFSDLVPYLLPMVFYGLGMFVAFVQAFVFCLLTMVYISLSTSHDH